VEFVQQPDGELPGFPALPAPDDRVWRHPSELPVAPTGERRPAGQPAWPMWPVAVTSGLVASLLAAGTIALIGSSKSPGPVTLVTTTLTASQSAVWLGIEGTDLTAAQSAPAAVASGAVVGRSMPGSPAERAGLAPSDVIVAVNGTSVPNMAALVATLRTHSPGEVVTVEILRGHQLRQMRVTLSGR